MSSKGELLYRYGNVEIREHENSGKEVWIEDKEFLLSDGDLDFLGASQQNPELRQERLRQNYPTLFQTVTGLGINPQNILEISERALREKKKHEINSEYGDEAYR